MSIQRQEPPIIAEIELISIASAGELVVPEDQAPYVETQPFYIRYLPFIATVVIPMAIVILYLFFIASDRYESQASFIVRSVNGGGNNPGNEIASLLQNSGLKQSSDETYAVNEYIMSRDMVQQLVQDDSLRSILSRPEADQINRFPNFYSWNNKEGLFRHYRNFVDVEVDGTTGISTLRVSAFRPGDAHALATAILRHSEELINRLNDRAYIDAENYAKSIVGSAQQQVHEIETRLTSFRNEIGSVDPGKESTAFFEIIGQMTTQLATLEAQLRRVTEVTPQSPTIPALRGQIKAYRAQIDKQRLQIVGNDKALASKLGEFENLSLKRMIAARELENAVDNLAKARQDARRQHLYLETIVAPNVSDYARYPRRLLWTLVDLMVCLGAFAILKAVSANIWEHHQ